MQYIEREGNEFFHTLKTFPEALNKKVTLLKYFRNYMSEHLLKVSVWHKLYEEAFLLFENVIAVVFVLNSEVLLHEDFAVWYVKKHFVMNTAHYWKK